MAESTPLLDDIDENTPLNNGGNNDRSGKTPASAHFKSLFKALAVITLILSFLAIALLIANYIIVSAAPLGNSNRWGAQNKFYALGQVVCTFHYLRLALSQFSLKYWHYVNR